MIITRTDGHYDELNCLNFSMAVRSPSDAKHQNLEVAEATIDTEGTLVGKDSRKLPEFTLVFECSR